MKRRIIQTNLYHLEGYDLSIKCIRKLNDYKFDTVAKSLLINNEFNEKDPKDYILRVQNEDGEFDYQVKTRNPVRASIQRI